MAIVFIKIQIKNKAIIVMHTFGHPVDLDKFLSIAKDWNLILIEDAAESLGSFYKNIHTGTFGDYGAISFNGNKIITTGGGACFFAKMLKKVELQNIYQPQQNLGLMISFMMSKDTTIECQI